MTTELLDLISGRSCALQASQQDATYTLDLRPCEQEHEDDCWKREFGTTPHDAIGPVLTATGPSWDHAAAALAATIRAHMQSTLQTFSFRAECPRDVEEAYTQLAESGYTFGDWIMQTPDPNFPDRHVQVRANMDFATFIDLLRRIEDGHVMHQTLRAVPLSDNSLERTH